MYNFAFQVVPRMNPLSIKRLPRLIFVSLDFPRDSTCPLYDTRDYCTISWRKMYNFYHNLRKRIFSPVYHQLVIIFLSCLTIANSHTMTNKVHWSLGSYQVSAADHQWCRQLVRSQCSWEKEYYRNSTTQTV